MGLKPGMTNNPNGRPKGIPNRVAREIKEKVTQFLEAKLPEMIAAYDQLGARDKVRYFEKLMPYVLPKNAAIEFEVTDPDGKTRPAWLTTVRAMSPAAKEDTTEAEIVD